MSFSEFLAEVKQTGLAKNNRFVVSIDGAGGYADNNNDFRKILLFCESAQLPGQSLATVPNRTFGEMRETPYDRLYEPITLNFYVDRAMHVKYFFDKWMDSIYNPATRKFSYYSDYTYDITIDVLDIQNNTNYRVALFEAYPKSVSAVALDQNNKDIMKLSVTFQYKNWTSQPLAVYYKGAGEPFSPGILESYNRDFYDVQNAFNNFTSNAVSTVTGGIPGFDGGLPDTQGFLTSATQKLTTFAQTSIFTKVANNMPKLSNIMNLRF
jgi:hypothetical protein